MLAGKKILIGITGGIAAYKIPFLIRLLIKEKAEVKVVMTPSATDFVTPLTLATLSQNPVNIEPFKASDGSWNSHVELGTWADIMIIAPLTANTLAKIAVGIADNLLLTTYLAARCPVFFAPAMDLDMYQHPSTQNNMRSLQSFGNILIEPQEGELASGLCGGGRMEEPQKIISIIKDYLKKKTTLKGKKAIVTAGPTYEPIDPVRFIGNYSSGKMGYCIADELASRGAEVFLVSGPVNQSLKDKNISIINITTAEEMYNAVINIAQDCDIVVMTAAVADFKPEITSLIKIKKTEEIPTIKLTKTKDILAELGKTKKPGQILVGFALETDNEIENANKKLNTKNLDLIVLNSLRDEGAGFQHSTNKITIIDKKGQALDFELKPKKLVATDIVQAIEGCFD